MMPSRRVQLAPELPLGVSVLGKRATEQTPGAIVKRALLGTGKATLPERKLAVESSVCAAGCSRGAHVGLCLVAGEVQPPSIKRLARLAKSGSLPHADLNWGDEVEGMDVA